MYNVSEDYLDALAKPYHRFDLYGYVGETYFTAENLIRETLTITNQCADSDIKIGSVYGGQLKATFVNMNIQRSEWQGQVIRVYEGLQLEDETFEYVPLGLFTIVECNHTLKGVEVVAYDFMSKFDALADPITGSFTPYGLLNFICSQCDVALGMSEWDITGLPNGMETLKLYSTNDIQTYRDVLYWIAQTLCCIATINRDGELELRQYSSAANIEIDEYTRFANCSFSDFVVNYTGATVEDLMADETKYVHASSDTGLTYVLGANPFIQGDDIERLAENIIDTLADVTLTPYTATRQGGAIYDLCDCVEFTGGIAGGVYGSIMSYSYSYGHDYKVEGFGKNPDLAKAETRAAKSAAAASKAANKKAIFYPYTNITSISIANGQTDRVASFSISSTDDSSVIFHAEIAHVTATAESELNNVYTENDCEITATIKINGREQTYHPVFTEFDGDQVLHLMYFFTIQSGSTVDLDVYLTCAGGSISIAEGKSRAYVSGNSIGAVGEFSTEKFISVYDDIRNLITEG